MTIEEILVTSPTVLNELATEFVRRGGECIDADSTSQTTACFLLAIRSVSLLMGIAFLMKPNSRDSSDVLTRAFMESRDLLMTFRFDEQGTRNKIKRWFEGNNDNTWRAEHKKCERFIKQLSGSDTGLGSRWSMFSAISHPTIHAAKQSTAMVVSWVTGRSKAEDYGPTMHLKSLTTSRQCRG